MKQTRVALLGCLLACLSVDLLPAASISLDTVGADPDLTSPIFSFTTDASGNFSATYRNLSNPPLDFVTLSVTAAFNAAFYNGPAGPRTVGASCNGGNVFRSCRTTLSDGDFTVNFSFFGVDSTHIGIPYNREFGIVATSFEPNQTVGAIAAPATTPEPGGFRQALLGCIFLCGLAISGKKFVKLRILP